MFRIILHSILHMGLNIRTTYTYTFILMINHFLNFLSIGIILCAYVLIIYVIGNIYIWLVLI